MVRVAGQELVEDPVVAEGVEEAELPGTDALPEPLGCEPPPPPEGTGVADLDGWMLAPPAGPDMLAEGEGCAPELPPPAGALAEQLHSVTVMVFTTVAGEPERGDSEGAEGAGAEPVGCEPPPPPPPDGAGAELEGAGAEDPDPWLPPPEGAGAELEGAGAEEPGPNPETGVDSVTGVEPAGVD